VLYPEHLLHLSFVGGFVSSLHRFQMSIKFLFVKILIPIDPTDLIIGRTIYIEVIVQLFLSG
jgi:hypothetical protein